MKGEAKPGRSRCQEPRGSRGSGVTESNLGPLGRCKASLLTPSGGEGKYNIYGKVPYKEFGTASTQKA